MTAVPDLKWAVRAFARTPGFTAVAVLTLGLGIGATTAIFSVVHGVLMKPLPYRDSGRLANIWVDLGVGNQSLPAVSPGDFRDYQQRSRLFESFAAATGAQLAGVNGALRAADGSETERVDVTPVSANFFTLMGADPDPRTSLSSRRRDTRRSAGRDPFRTASGSVTTAATQRSSAARFGSMASTTLWSACCPRRSACSSRSRRSS